MRVIYHTTLEKYCKLSFGLATLVLLCLGTAVAQTTYTLTDLGTLGGEYGEAGDIANSGSAVGGAVCPVIQQHTRRSGPRAQQPQPTSARCLGVPTASAT